MESAAYGPESTIMWNVKKIPDISSSTMPSNQSSIRRTPSQRTSFSNPHKLYEVWLGNNKFLCGGRLIFGPDAASLLLSTFLIGAPAIAFCLRMLVRMREHHPIFGCTVLLVGVILTVLDLTFLYLTSSRDPGIVPRNAVFPETDEANSPSIEWVASKTPNLRLPRTKDMMVNDYTVKVKFCDTCKLYRPPRASHCSICNNCVQRFDHHCPWVGQCIGLRNYRVFILFISTSTFLGIYVFSFSLINILSKGSKVRQAMSQDISSVILAIYCFIAVWFVGGLTVFHMYLICANQTTYENFRYRYDKKKNPHNLGVLNNLRQIFCSKIPPSAINFRELVFIDDISLMHESPSHHEGSIDKVKKIDMGMRHMLKKDGNSELESIMPNFDYAGIDDMLKKQEGNQDAAFNLFLMPSEQESPQHGRASVGGKAIEDAGFYRVSESSAGL